jgi:hypothetical protein
VHQLRRNQRLQLIAGRESSFTQRGRMTSKREVLEELSIGSRVAEDETDQLAAYFVETDQWRKVSAGDVDVIFGSKGSGKSAIYSTLINRTNEMFDRGILFVSAENPRGTPAFKDLIVDPPTSEAEFTGLWKFYFLSLLCGVLEEYSVGSPSADRVLAAMREADLYEGSGTPLPARIKAALDYVRRLLRVESLEGGLQVDPATGQTGITGKISLREPGAEQRKAGIVSADELIGSADLALKEVDLSVWILLDRLDVAFADSVDLEANALRALFKVYLDLAPREQIRLKIFLRSDIWAAVTEPGFREASHITRQLELRWNDPSLLNLLVRRLLQNRKLLDYYAADSSSILSDSDQQRSFFAKLVPEQIDSGRNPKTFEWMLGRIRDGSGKPAPRELIHLASATRDVQLAMLERGGEEPSGELLFTRQAFRDALPQISKTRLEQTLFAEYPDLKDAIQALEGQKTNHSVASLAAIWHVEPDVARARAMQLVDVGFFETRGTRDEPDYWVPFLYRPALSLVQGSAD